MTSINSLGIKLGNTNSRIACASLTEWGSLSVNCLNGIDEQFSTKTLFTMKANAEYSGGFEQCLANDDEFHPSNIVFDALNFKNSNSISYSDDEFGDIFAKKQENGKYKLEFCDENDQRHRNVEYQDIEVTAGILAKLMEAANEQLPEKGAELQQIVITVPSLAEYEYREKMMKAVKILGLPSNIDVQFIAQITAAAIAYRHKEGDSAQGNVLFFYMGARSTEFALYKFLDGQTPELLCADGFVDFGGENFTARLVKQQMAILKEENRQNWERKMDDEEKRTVYRNVRMAMEKIKAQLGCKESATVKMDLGPTLHGQKFTITREQFEEICKDQWQQLATFLIAKLKHFKEQINRIVLVGESSKLYLVQNLFCKFNEKLILPMNALAPELAAVQGAAIKASYEALKRNGNTLPKCLTKAIIPNNAFRGIYANIYLSDLPSYLARFGQQIPTNDIPINSVMNITLYEECGENDKEIMKFTEFKWKSEKYFIQIDNNGLLRFKRNNGQIWCPRDDELEKCMKKFKQYESDVLRVKLEQTEWEKKRKEERRLKAQRELEEKKRQQQQLEEEAKKAQELANKQKLIDEENEKKEKEEAKLKLKYSKNQQEEEKENCGTTETKVIDKDGGENEKKKSATLEDDKVLNESFEVVPPALDDDFDIVGHKKTVAECSTSTTTKQQLTNSGSHQNQKHKDYVDVLIEIDNDRGKGKPADTVFLKGSWDEWKGKIPMKYSQYTNSFLAVLSLPISKGDYEFLHSNQERGWLFDYKYPNRNPKTLNKEDWGVNFIKFNSTTQIGNQNLSWKENKDLLEKILFADTFIADLVNHIKNSQQLDFSAQQINKVTQKYREIRKAISTKLQINSQEVKQLIDEADLAVTNVEIIFFVRYDWAKFEDGNYVVKKSEMATKIRTGFMKKLLQFTMSKEEAIHQFKHYFCYPLLEECIRNGLEHGVSEEIQQLKTFMDANFLHNLPTGSAV